MAGKLVGGSTALAEDSFWRYVSDLYPNYFFLLLCLTFVAFGMHMFNVMLAVDDWGFISDLHFADDWSNRIGRWTSTIIWNLTGSNYPAPAFTLVAMVSSNTLFILYLLYRCGAPILRATIALPVFLFSPYWIEAAGFENLHLIFAVGTLLVIVACEFTLTAVHSMLRGTPNYWVIAGCVLIATMCVALYLGIYQTFLFFHVVSLALIACAPVFRVGDRFLRRLILIFGLGAVSVVGGTWIYHSVHVALQQALSWAPPGIDQYKMPTTISLADMSQHLEGTVEAIVDLWFRSQAFFPATAKFIVLGLMLIGITTFLSDGKGLGVLRIATMVCVVALITMLPILMYLFFGKALRYTSVTVFALLPVVPIVFSSFEGAPKFLRHSVAILAVSLSGIFVAQNSMAGASNYLNNLRDLHVVAWLYQDAFRLAQDQNLRFPVEVHIWGRHYELTNQPFTVPENGARMWGHYVSTNTGVLEDQLDRMQQLQSILLPTLQGSSSPRMKIVAHPYNDVPSIEAFRQSDLATGPFWPEPGGMVVVGNAIHVRIGPIYPNAH